MAWSTYVGAVGVSASEEPGGDSDFELLTRAGAGDDRAARLLVRRHAERLHGIVERSHGDLQVSEDIVQEAFLKAIARAHQLRAEEAFFPWLVRIALRTALDARRRTWRERFSLRVEEVEPADSTPDPEASTQSEMLRRDVRRALWLLPSRPRELLILRYFAHFSVAELSRVFDKSEVAVRKDLQRARRRLERRLGRWFEEAS